MENRFALTAVSMIELKSKLAAYLAGQNGIEEIYFGLVRREKDTLSTFAADEDIAQAIETWVAKGKYGKLLELWARASRSTGGACTARSSRIEYRCRPILLRSSVTGSNRRRR